MGFPRQEYWSGLSFPSPGDVPDPGMETEFPVFAGRLLTTEPVGKFLSGIYTYIRVYIYKILLFILMTDSEKVGN